MAYIGPGAGFAFLGSFLTLLWALLVSVGTLLTWPIRMAVKSFRRGRSLKNARVKKVIFLGLDGFDPGLAERFMAEGRLPNLSRLREQGSYRRLRTTFPSLSPVAWSTFATGVNPAKHNIFDFLNRNLKNYLPELSSSRVNKPLRVWKIGKYAIPLSRSSVDMRRKSMPFWKILGEHQVDSTILRVPITFPPEKFNGRLLSAMSTPDLRGTQGSFSFFSTRQEQVSYEQGSRYPLHRNGKSIAGVLEGPDHPLIPGAGVLKIPFAVKLNGSRDGGELEIQDETLPLRLGEYTPWVNVKFSAGIGVKAHGICRFLLTQIEPDVNLYATPINIDPEKPALPISHPAYYSAYLAKLLGTFATVGMAEDTWALNEGAIDDDAFLEQAYAIHQEREAMFFSALDRLRHGVAACVFDSSDRIQHMFYRYLENRAQGKHQETIQEMYARMDAMVGRALKYVDKDTVLFVLSDHGFGSFRRGVNLNTWLVENGYLALKDGARTAGPYFKGVDWSRTRAYTLGLAGLYLNIKGREAEGVVKPGEEAEALKAELIQKLSGLVDPESGEVAIQRVYATNRLYRGPYLGEAPDFIVGFSNGYRVSWDAAQGKITTSVFEDNAKAWSGDHSMDPVLVPGVLFSNRKIDAEDPGLEDMAPTTLALFGIEKPAHMEGKPIFTFSGAPA
ncbi:MAG: alkaline phosphatase family protein [Bryobacteraceae bacterium]|nr:alkaline phosphatase family protein [Bryobacteraceae bacterium]